MSICSFSNQSKFPFVLPALPYASNALAPFVSEETFSFHHQKHHNTYIVNLNKLIEGTELASLDLETIIIQTFGKADKIGIYNNAAQVWNHSFFWQSMSAPKSKVLGGEILKRIEREFGSFASFADAFKNTGASQFGSGWVWVCEDASGKIVITKTSNADTPVTQGLNPLLTCDVWEHAYYIDYQNRRLDFLTAFIENLANWEVANQRLKH
jgi:Fe-Mn family superoxide dismutase